MSHQPTDDDASAPADYASWLPRDIPYDSTFEDAVSDLLLSPPSNTSGLRVIPPSSDETPVAGLSVLESSIDPSSLPSFSATDLPLSVSDPRRVYASPISGLNLTHPGGYLEGGPGIAPGEDEYARHFLAEHGVRTGGELERVRVREMARYVDMARERARARRQAREKNDEIEAEIRALGEQMEMETKVLNKAREKARERRERMEKRRDG